MKDVRSTGKTYEAPKLTRHGSFRDLTLGQASGAFLDATFPAGTPFADLTFSS